MGSLRLRKGIGGRQGISLQGQARIQQSVMLLQSLNPYHMVRILSYGQWGNHSRSLRESGEVSMLSSKKALLASVCCRVGYLENTTSLQQESTRAPH